MVPTPYDRLINSIRNGRIPLISIESGNEDGSAYELQVYPRFRTSKYIAISHVWIDGLGNTNQNAVPVCQVKRLKGALPALRRHLAILM